MGRYLENDLHTQAEIRKIVEDVLVEHGLITAKAEEADDDAEEARHVAE